MLSKLRTLINTINKTDSVTRILTFPTHEGYQTLLGKIPNIEWHMYHPNGGKTQWDFATRPLPENHYLYNSSNISGDQTYDFVLSQEPLGQFPIARNIADTFGIPLISLFHTEPYPGMSAKKTKAIRDNHRAEKTVFITKHNQESWGYNDDNSVVIPHGVDESVFQGYNQASTEACGVSLVNHLQSRSVFCGAEIFNHIASQTPVRLIGDNPGISTSINDTSVLAKELCKFRYYLNTSILSPLPMSLLEGACCGIPIVSTKMQQVPLVFTHGQNALLSNNPDELLGYCKMLLDNKEEAARLGAAARQLMIDRFGMGQFIANWRKTLNV